MHTLIAIAVVLVTLLLMAVLWLLFGPHISRGFDHLCTGSPTALPTDQMSIEFDPTGISSRFTLGSTNRSLSWPDSPHPFELNITLDDQGRLVLTADNRSFTLGPIHQKWTAEPKPQYQFSPDPGDAVTFTRDISRLPWLTPFTFNFLGGATPKAKRYAYDRLGWTKPSGATLQITWTNEFWYYPGSGWSDQWNLRLAKVEIHPSPAETAAISYLAAAKGWSTSEFRLESQSSTPAEEIISVIYLKDETPTHPGAGKSVILHVNKTSCKVTSETAWQ
jgi:hypothetical protein